MQFLKYFLFVLLAGASLVPNIDPDALAIFVGSTPCDTDMRKAFAVPEKENCEFIKWRLQLDDGNKRFQMAVTFGESQPNTNGFKGGGTRREITGTFQSDESFYRLQSPELQQDLFLVVLNDNLFHLADENGQLLVGNGGFSYLLNRTPKVIPSTNIEPMPGLMGMTAGVFDGCTPCDELAPVFRIAYTPECIKMKWRLKLFNTTSETGTFDLLTINYRDQNALKGTWRMTLFNPQAPVLALELPTLHQTVYLLKASDDVLLFLNDQKQIRVGNHDFSYALNRMPGK